MMKSKHNRRRNARAFVVVTWAVVLLGAFIIITQRVPEPVNLPLQPIDAASGESIQSSTSVNDLQGTAGVDQAPTGANLLQGGQALNGGSGTDLY